MKKTVLLITIIIFFTNCKQENKKSENNEAQKADVQTFLDDYTKTFTKLYYDSSLAEWDANTKIIDGDTLNAYNIQKANGAFAKFTGNTEIINKTRAFLENENNLDIKQVRQLKTILYSAANNPETVSDLVSQRIAAENAQNEVLFGFDFQVNGTSVSTGNIEISS